MARTAVVRFKIRNNGTPLGVIGFDTIDLTGTLSATDSGNGVVNITGSGGGTGTNVDTRIITGAQSGADVTLDLTTLPHTFTAVEVVFRNGQALTPILSWTISGSTVTVLNADAGETFMVQYTY